MTYRQPLLAFARTAFLAGCLVAQSGWAQPKPDFGPDSQSRINSVARLLAGLAPGHPAHLEVARDKAWKEHSSLMRAAWARVSAGQVSAMTAWRDAVLPRTCPAGSTLLYPFSGPDFFNAYRLFPNCETFVLFGLEPIGEAPGIESMNAREFARLLADIRDAMANVFARNYFVTGRMVKKLQTDQLRGVMPVFMISMALSGVAILRIAPLELEPAPRAEAGPGTRSTAAGRATGPLKGVTIEFRGPGSAAVGRMHYFSLDAANAGIARYPYFLDFLRGLAPTTTLVKSASYLLHGAGFSRLRDVLLDASAFLVQDDTGLPYSMLIQRGWRLRLYGRYEVPIPPFEYAFQPELARAYQAQRPLPLPFSFGYYRDQRENRSNVMVGSPLPSRGSGPDAGATTEADRPVSARRSG